MDEECRGGGPDALPFSALLHPRCARFGPASREHRALSFPIVVVGGRHCSRGREAPLSACWGDFRPGATLGTPVFLDQRGAGD